MSGFYMANDVREHSVRMSVALEASTWVPFETMAPAERRCSSGAGACSGQPSRTAPHGSSATPGAPIRARLRPGASSATLPACAVTSQ